MPTNKKLTVKYLSRYGLFYTRLPITKKNRLCIQPHQLNWFKQFHFIQFRAQKSRLPKPLKQKFGNFLSTRYLPDYPRPTIKNFSVDSLENASEILNASNFLQYAFSKILISGGQISYITTQGRRDNDIHQTRTAICWVLQTLPRRESI